MKKKSKVEGRRTKVRRLPPSMELPVDVARLRRIRRKVKRRGKNG